MAFGTKNLFPQDIINYNSKSPVNASIIESTVTYICGKGVRDSQPNAKKYVGVPNANESWDDLIEKVAKDYKTFGGFYWQVIVNKGSTTVSLFHQDFSQVRIGEITETGKPVTFRISKDWTKTSGKNKPLELPVWPGSVSKAKKGVAYLFYHWDYTPGLNFYCVPGYYPAIEYIKADGTLGQFYNNSIDNGFTPSVVINMPSNPSEEKKAAFQKQMEDAFAGAKGASSIVILWGESDAVKPGITPFNASANADIYNNVEGIVFQKIISAHRLSSPTLAGVSGSGNLSGNAAEIIDAYVLYNYTVIEKLRRKILDKLNVFTKINGTGELFIEDLDVLPKIRETETTTEDVVVEEGAATLSKKDNAVIRLLKRLLFRNAA
ncbi:phage portal protein [Bacteroides stercorirosoris]|uniref:phage portal protein n=1 Tax=Bacteroides stercorirosoris TaxID=871324 RepID=UPI001FB0B065|nr:phage portal protein [Bacteroides stercorirosoris]